DSGAISEGGSCDVLAENRCLGMQIVALIYIEEGLALALNETVGGEARDWRLAVSIKLSLLDSHYVVAIFRKKSKRKLGAGRGRRGGGTAPRAAPSSYFLEATGSRGVCGSGPVLVLAGHFAIPGL
ncbi:hypothetical protein L249_5648, partial [Ophiocordyceps polyrhachis-furcata BCC 54312]